MNSFMWAHMIDEDKNVAKEMVPYLSEKLGKPITEIDSMKFLKSAEDMYKNAYDPNVTKDLFERK